MPVIAAGLALAIVLPLTGGGAPKAKTTVSTTGASHASAPVTGLTGAYIGIATGPQPFYLTLLQSGTSLSGTLDGVSATSPEKLTDTSTKVTGNVKGSKLTLVAQVGGQAYPTTGSISGSSFTIDFGQGDNVVFKPGTLSQFDQIVARDRPSLLAQGAAVADRAAESNLVNALTEAKALYQVNQSYSSSPGHPYGVRTFSMQAPEFTWTTGACGSATANCISIQVLDVFSDHDAQGVALSAYSPETSTCWYAIDLEAGPRVVHGDASALQSTARGPNASVTVAGAYYARSPVGSTPSSCSASLVLHAHKAGWRSDFADAGALS